ncbi:MAG: PEP/pyruvate-binding domain-containing protein [Thermoplasmatota archaeon]
MNGREEKIKNIIKDITGKFPDKDEGDLYNLQGYMGAFSIKNVLMVSSSFDYFLIEEGGRLNELMEETFTNRLDAGIPNITQVETSDECMELLENTSIDLLLIFNGLEEMDIIEFSRSVKQDYPEVPVVLLGNDTDRLEDISGENEGDTIDEVFTWNGDGKIILSIIQYIEDKKNLQEEVFSEEAKGILLIEDSIQYYSSYFPLIYEEIWSHTDSMMNEDLPREVKLNRKWSRPFLLLAHDLEEGRSLFEEYQERLACMITDNHLHKQRGEEDEKTGLKFALEVRERYDEIPILVQSSEPIEDIPEGSDIDFVLKKETALNTVIKDFVEDVIGPEKLIIEKEEGMPSAEINSLEDLEKKLWNIDPGAFVNTLREGGVYRWLKARAESELAEELEAAVEGLDDPSEIKDTAMNVMEEHRYTVHKGTVSSFKRREYNPYIKLSRIGKGALGGKARGLAFTAKMLSEYVNEDMFEGLRITIPRTIILSTEVYDSFLEDNELLSNGIEDISDERISSKFMDSSLPPTVLGDLRSFVSDTRKPLIVRSSGVLEDSMTQPFAGIYSSMFLPNESWETDLRFKEVTNAIKQVYSSTFFERARNYLASTPKKLGDEKMGVILQEVIGDKHGKYFYPTISGVAKSHNHYPSGNCKPEDGIVYLALGLGKSIVEGGNTFCFCPEHPDAPLSGTPKDFMKDSQTEFYAIDLESVYRSIKKDEETSLVKLDLDKAEKHGVLDKVASTYSPQDDRLYPGINRKGYRVVDFAPLIKYSSLPVAKALKMLLKVSEISLGYPVEIEFAININKEKGEPSELVVLQVRSMISDESFVEIERGEYSQDELLCFSDDALGNGVIEGIRDVVYIKKDSFEMKNSQDAVGQIKKINSRLMEKNRPYVLIGPGRWGSSDRWLGIPVIWSDIAGAKVIIETPTEGRRIEPSQGSHFFHDMISSRAGYFITDKGKDGVDWEWLDSQDLEYELEFIKHVSTEEPLEVRIDGRGGKGVIIKKSNNVDDEGDV